MAISNERLLKLEQGCVTFRWKNCAAQGKQQTMTLTAVEFLRRFLLHTLPSHFVRMRHYGFLANRHRRDRVALCQRLLGILVAAAQESETATRESQVAEDSSAEVPEIRCERCRVGLMVALEVSTRPTAMEILARPVIDSS